jgi:hypothetical protein
MAIYPKIQSPCPYKGEISSIMDGDICRLCKRQVFDLTDLSDDARVAFMKGCSGEVCVSYRVPFRPVLMATAIAAATIGVPTVAAACTDATTEMVVTVGGINDPANVEYVKDTSDSAVPELPVIYEGKPADQSRDTSYPAREPVSSPSAS